MVSISTTNEEKVLVTLAPVTAAGNPAILDGAPKWGIAEGDCTLEVAEDGLSAYLVSGAANVINQITITADADLDEGEVREISETIVYTVVPAEAAAIGVSTVVEPKAIV